MSPSYVLRVFMHLLFTRTSVQCSLLFPLFRWRNGCSSVLTFGPLLGASCDGLCWSGLSLGDSRCCRANLGDPEPSTSQLFCPPDLPCFEAEDLPGVLGWPHVSGRGPVAALLHGGLRIQLQPLSLQMGKPSPRQERLSYCHTWWQHLPSLSLAQAWCPL